MKEYLSEAVAVILGLFITVFWSLIKTHFKVNQHDKAINDMNVQLTELKKEVSETKLHVAEIKEATSTIKDQNKTLLDLFTQHIVNK